jgi:methionine-gamma-lyase
MSAIATLLLTAAEQGDVIVHSGPLYAACESFIARQMTKYGVNYLNFPAGASRAELDKVLAQARHWLRSGVDRWR